eukprot:2814270-Amphidinium_carterae.2
MHGLMFVVLGFWLLSLVLGVPMSGERVAFENELHLDDVPSWDYLDPEIEFVSASHVEGAGEAKRTTPCGLTPISQMLTFVWHCRTSCQRSVAAIVRGTLMLHNTTSF